MNFLKRAWQYLRHKKGRTALLVLVTSAIMLFVLAGLIIQTAAIQAVKNTVNSAGTTVTLSANREKAFEKLRDSQSSSSSTSTKTRPTLNLASVSIATAEKIGKLSQVAGYQLTSSASVNASGFDAIETSSSTQSFPGGGGNDSSRGDISISGVSTTAAESGFQEKTDTITSGRGITAADVNTNNVVIEKNLAEQNSLKVGSKIKVKTTDSKTTKTLTIVGIYTAKTSSSSSTGGMMGGFGQSDPANTIYGSYTLAGALNGNTTEVSSVTYTLSDSSQEKAFTAAAKKLIDTDELQLVSSSETYEQLLQPMKNVESFANKIVWIVGIAGTIILALLIVLMIRERRHEVGVLLSLGESKTKMVGQLFAEMIVVLAASLVIAGGLGATFGSAVSKQLVTQQLSSQTTTTQNAGFGGGGAPSGAPTGGGNFGGGGRQMNASGSNSVTKKALSNLNTTLKPTTFVEVAGLGLGIIALATLIGATPIFRLKPKEILTSE